MESVPVIVCAGANGRCVIYGRCDHMPQVGESAVLTGARMILWWERIGLFGVASRGPMGGARLSSTVPQTQPGPAVQVLAVTEDAARVIEAWPAYE